MSIDIEPVNLPEAFGQSALVVCNGGTYGIYSAWVMRFPCTWLAVVAYQGLCTTCSETLLIRIRTYSSKSLHPNICTAVHCSISLHPQLPWYHESAYYWGLPDQA